MRLFVAFEIPAALRQSLAARLLPLRSSLPAARWTAPAGQHLTLRFLGATDPAQLADLGSALTAACTPVAPLTLTISGAGAFPPRGTARVLWAGVEAQGDLHRLKKRIDEAVEATLGLASETRPYHAHITLARCRKPWPRSAVAVVQEALVQPLPDATFTASAVTLFESTLHPDGAVYRSVATYSLGGGGE